MMREIMFIVRTIASTIRHDILGFYDRISKPKEILNVLFWIFLISVLAERYFFAKVTIILYVIAYVWKIIKQGDWRKKLRESYV